MWLVTVEHSDVLKVYGPWGIPECHTPFFLKHHETENIPYLVTRLKLTQATIYPSTKLCALNCWMGVYIVVWRGPCYMRVILLSLDTKTYRGTQLLLYQCVHFLKPLAFTDASIETSAPFSVEQTAFGASRYSCCVHLLSCNRFHWEALYMW